MGIDQNNMAFPDRSRMLLALAAVSSVIATNPAYMAYHNNYRQLHNATLLSYDATVAASAQSWANSMSPNGAGCSTHSSGTGYGENLAWTSSSTPTADVSYLDSVQSWYSEVKDWSFSTSGHELCSHWPLHPGGVGIVYQGGVWPHAGFWGHMHSLSIRSTRQLCWRLRCASE